MQNKKQTQQKSLQCCIVSSSPLLHTKQFLVACFKIFLETSSGLWAHFLSYIFFPFWQLSKTFSSFFQPWCHRSLVTSWIHLFILYIIIFIIIFNINKSFHWLPVSLSLLWKASSNYHLEIIPFLVFSSTSRLFLLLFLPLSPILLADMRVRGKYHPHPSLYTTNMSTLYLHFVSISLVPLHMCN